MGQLCADRIDPSWQVDKAGIITESVKRSSRTRFRSMRWAAYPGPVLGSDSISAGSNPSSRSLAANWSARRCWLSAPNSILGFAMLFFGSAMLFFGSAMLFFGAFVAGGQQIALGVVPSQPGRHLVVEEAMPDAELDSERLDPVVASFVGR